MTIIYLHAHTSHVLQPLDLSVFSSLKRVYWKYLDDMLSPRLDHSTVAGKCASLSCYWRARDKTLTARTGRARWSTTGLWLVNLAKPLMIRLLLPNSNNPRPAPTTTIAPEWETLANPLVENLFPPLRPHGLPLRSAMSL